MNPSRIVFWAGPVNVENAGKMVEKMLTLVKEDREAEIFLLVHSSGGDSAVAFAFFDMVKGMDINLTTVAMGYVKSAGVTIFLSGRKRLVATHSAIFLHEGSVSFNSGADFSRAEVAAVRRSGEISDDYYDAIILEQLRGDAEIKMTPQTLQEMKRSNTYLLPSEVLKYGLAHDIWRTSSALA